MPPPEPARTIILALAVLWLPLAGFCPASETPNKTAQPAAGAANVGSGLTAFGQQIPAQRPNFGIYIPSFSSGKPSSIIEAEVLTRVDDFRLQAEQMTIHLFGKEEKDQITVDLPTATYNMTNQILRSNERSKVSRADFDLEGDSLIFDTTTSQGRMTGNVRMTIYDTGAFMQNAAKPRPPQAPAADSGTAEPAPVSPPAPASRDAPQPAPSKAEPKP